MTIVMLRLRCVLAKPQNLHPAIGFPRFLPENLRFTIAPVGAGAPAAHRRGAPLGVRMCQNAIVSAIDPQKSHSLWATGHF